MGGDRAALTEEPARSTAGRRPAGDLGHHPHAEMRRALAGLPSRVWPADDRLQPLEPLEPQGHLVAHPGGADRARLDRRDRPDRQQLHQGPSLRRWRKRGARINAIGVSRGGRTTKVHALVDVLGRPLRLILTPGNTSDVKGADQLIGESARMKRLIADKGYDADRLRAAIRKQGTIPVIPGRRNRKRPIQYDERRYRDRWQIEAMFCRLKDFRRIATLYESSLATSTQAWRSPPPSPSGSERV
jgi:transposase